MDPQYSKRLEKIEGRLSSVLPRLPDGLWMDAAFTGRARGVSADLAHSLTGPGWDMVSRGGKRWRPLLLTLICEALGGGDAAFSLVPLVELPHNASLIHDDIEDNSDERRGKPAAHILFGTDTAINSGCFLYFLPLICIDSWDTALELKHKAYAVWGEHMRRLHLGQAMDIHWHRHFEALPSPEEYTLMCRLKTGALARLAAVLGVYTGIACRDGVCPAEELTREKTETLADLVGEAAEKLGVGFQILDDVKNLSAGIPGKKRGDDIVEGKKSLPALLFMRQNPGKLPLVARCFKAAREGGAGVPEVAELIGEFEKAGVLEQAKTEGLTLIAEAQEVLTAIGGNNGEIAGENQEARRLLAGFTALIS
jgi:octaprenyl-diphosphate synthase